MPQSLRHPLLEAFRTSRPAFGVWLALPSAVSARAVASASPHLSWVCIDCEHGTAGLHPGAAEIVHAIAGLGPDAPSAIVRIPATGACADESAGWQIKHALDAGARGVVVPMVRPLRLYRCIAHFFPCHLEAWLPEVDSALTCEHALRCACVGIF